MTANVTVWFSAIFTWANVGTLATLIATGAATAVSIATFIWIRKQSNAFDKEQAEREEERKRLAAEKERQSWLADRNRDNRFPIPRL